MGLSLLSALQIQGNETLIDSYKDNKSGKWGYIITPNEQKYCRPIVSCNSVYDSKEIALKEGDEFRDRVRGLDLDPSRKSLVRTVGGTETAKTIDKIVKGSKDDGKK